METTHPNQVLSQVQAQATDCLNAVAQDRGLSPERSARLLNSAVARHIASLPFWAGCDEAERTAYARVDIYVAALSGSGRTLFDHTPADDVSPGARMRIIQDIVKGGDREMVEAGFAREEYVQLCGYLRDFESGKDKAAGEYNPVLFGRWDADNLREQLIARSRFGDFAEMDAVLSQEVAPLSFWF